MTNGYDLAKEKGDVVNKLVCNIKPSTKEVFCEPMDNTKDEIGLYQGTELHVNEPRVQLTDFYGDEATAIIESDDIAGDIKVMRHGTSLYVVDAEK